MFIRKDKGKKKGKEKLMWLLHQRQSLILSKKSDNGRPSIIICPIQFSVIYFHLVKLIFFTNFQEIIGISCTVQPFIY